MFELVLNEAIYHQFLAQYLPKARSFVWFVTADIKDLYVDFDGKFQPLLAYISKLVDNNVAVRLIHAKEPGKRFREDFDQYDNLLDNELFERILCPRVHTKTIIIDAAVALVSSANLTGAGVGAKHKDKRNFEAGFIVKDNASIEQLMDFVDQLYLGQYCHDCRRRDICPDPIA